MKFSKLFLAVSIMIMMLSSVEARGHYGGDYNIGYDDGCKNAQGYRNKDQTLYTNSYRYRDGYNHGRRECRVVKKHYLNSYEKGYNHGCRSSKGKWTKNKRAYRKYSEYRNGWKEGRRACKRRVSSRRSFNYDLGYDDGCKTSSYGYTRDEYRYDNYRSYRRGFRAGKRACY